MGHWELPCRGRTCSCCSIYLDCSRSAFKILSYSCANFHGAQYLFSSLLVFIHFSATKSNSNLAKASSILKGEKGFITQLQQWLGEKCKWNLCYRASRDGWSARNFHRNCDNKGPTVVLIKVNEFIFGGYTDQNWAGIRLHVYAWVSLIIYRYPFRISALN